MNAVSYLQYSGPVFFLHFSSTFVWPGPSLVVVFIPLGEHGAALPQPGWVKQLNPWPVVRYSPAIISLEHTIEQKIHCYFRITTLAINGLADTYPWRIQLITSPENLRAYSSVGTLRSECQYEIEFKPREDQDTYLYLFPCSNLAYAFGGPKSIPRVASTSLSMAFVAVFHVFVRKLESKVWVCEIF